MSDFWLDSDSLITAKNGPYGFDIAPSFWRAIEHKLGDKTISSSSTVFDELTEGDEDDLFIWAKEQKENGHFIDPDELVQACFREIAEYVYETYPLHQAGDFLDGADPWLIAHAKVYGGKVVTFEKSAPNSSRPKIPDVARHFEVKTLEIYQMIRELGITL